MLDISEFISVWRTRFPELADVTPWNATERAEAVISDRIQQLGTDYRRTGTLAVHRTATVEDGAILKGPVIVGPEAFIASGAYLRGGVFLEANSTVGPSCELKSVYMFAGSKIAHFSFVGDSLIGVGVNIEAGAIIANFRNELDDKHIQIQRSEGILRTDVTKFGALVGDFARIGANAVIAPGAILDRNAKIPRLSLVDQAP